MDAQRLRAWWWQRQGLDGSLAQSSAAQVLEQAGWARSVGGVGPYLTLWSRAGIRRAAADAGVARLEIHELPSARSCTYVLPASDFALGLQVGQSMAEAEMKTAAKLGVTGKEVDTLCGKVVAALASGPLDPDQLKEAAGSAVRNLGEEGKKRGITTTLPLALSRLQAHGEIRRVPVNGRLDQQRYRYVAWTPSPLAGRRLPDEEAWTELARRYFRWTGPATLAEFQWFAGVSGRVAKAASEPLSLKPVGDRWLLSKDVELFESLKIPKDPVYALVGSLDSIAALRRDVKTLLDAGDFEREVIAEKGRRPISAFSDLPDHAIVDRGRLVGLWEFDPESQSIAWMSFVKRSKPLEEAVRAAEAYVREDLGDARSFSLDSPKSRAPRIAALRG
jgi:hypothetical protein